MIAATSRQRLRARWCVLRAGMGLGIRQCLSGDRGDVHGVDERLGTIPGRHSDQAADERQVVVAEVLHDPGGAENRVGEPEPAHEVEFDRPDRELGRGPVDAVGTEVGDMPYSSVLGEVKEV